MQPRVPFKQEPRGISAGGISSVEAEARLQEWTEGIKALARANLASGESMRIAWQNRFKVPRYGTADRYTPEELLLELWEQHYFENPESLDLKGIQKRRNPKTGHSYYITGDPIIDELEAAFGRGERPDLSILDGVGAGGRDVFREPVFIHTQAGKGFEPGMPTAPEQGLAGVRDGPDGAKITAGGAKVTYTDFSNDDWIKRHLEQDTALTALAKKGGDG